MDGAFYLKILILIVIADFIFERFLEYLNIKNKSELPAEIADIFTKENFLKSRKYLEDNTRFGFIDSTFNVLIFLGILYFGLLGKFDLALQNEFKNPVVLSLAFIGILFFFLDIIHLPFSYYKTFVIETKYGFNKMTIKTFFLDKLKGYILGGIIGGLILWGFFSLINYLGPSFWLYFWVLISVFILLVNTFYTSVIVPLFNKLTPLENGPLRDALEHYSAKVNFPLKNIFVIDGSKRSSKANAFFSGMGSQKKVVLYDTLIKNHTTEELTAILAHEVGHYKKRHIITGLIFSILQIGFMLWLLSKFLFNISYLKHLARITYPYI